MLFRSLSDQVEVSAGDVLCPQALSETRKGVDFSFYLIHSKSKGSNFHELDIQAARAFSQAARQTRFKRFSYLGALGDPEASLSRQLHSRQETGQALRDSGVPFAVFRVAVIVGLSTTSFVMIRYLGKICLYWSAPGGFTPAFSQSLSMTF